MRSARQCSPGSWRGLRAAWGATLGASLALFCSRWLYEQGPAGLLFALPWLGHLPMVALQAVAAASVGAVAVQWPSAGRWSLRLWALLLLNLYTWQGAPSAEAATLVGGAAVVLTVAGWPAGPGSRRVEALLAGLVAGLGLALYLPGLPASLLVGDSGELQVAAATLGIAHPTGYPLYLLLGKAFTMLPAGDPAHRVSLLSAVAASLALAALYGVARRARLGRRPSVAVALLAGAGPVYWEQATRAEVYALHMLFVGLILLLALDTRLLARRLRWACLLVGLGLAHHRTIVLLVPAVAVGLMSSAWIVSSVSKGVGEASHSLSLWERVRVRALGPREPLSVSWPVAATSLVALAMPLLTYLYLPWRWESWFGRPPQPAELVAQATGGAFLPLLQPLGWLSDPIRWDFLVRLLDDNLGWPALGLAGVGLLATIRRSPRTGGVLVLAALPPLVFSAAYYVPDAEVFALPGLVILAILAGRGANSVVRLADAARQWIYPMSGEAWPRGFGDGLSAAIVLGLVLSILPGVSGRLGPPGTDPSEASATLARRLAAVELPAGSLVVADVDRRAPLLYATRVLSPREDVEVVMPDTGDQVRQIVESALAAGRPVYLARYHPDLGRDHPIHGLGDLAEVRREPVWLGATSPLGRAVDGPALMSAVFPPAVQAGETLEVALEWAHPGGMGGRHRPRLLLLGAPEPEGTPGDPVNGLYPTAFWRPGEVVPDRLRLAVPWWLPPRRYAVAIEFYSAWPGPPLPVEGGGRRLVLGEVEVRPPAAVAEALTPVRAWVGESILLEGYRLDGPALPGRQVVATFAWRGEASGLSQTQVVLEREAGAEPLVLQGATSVDGRFVVRYAGAVGPAKDGPGAPPPLGVVFSRLRVTPAPAEGVAPPEVRAGWAAPAGEAMEVALPDQASPSVALARFGDLIELTGASLADPPAPGVAPGVLSLELTWRALAHPRESLTVFVHVRRLDGPVVAQIDRPPVQGTYPTDRWPPGQVVRDPYRLPLAAGLEAGEYAVEVGLYRRATLERLPISDAAGHSAGDAYRVGTLLVP